jgi:hypothetical protein
MTRIIKGIFTGQVGKCEFFQSMAFFFFFLFFLMLLDFSLVKKLADV